MIIENNKVISFHYQLTDIDDQQLDASDQEPMAYLHGSGNILPKLEAALTGHKAGDELTIELDPVDGYGVRDETMISRVPVKAIRGGKGKRLKPGSQVYVNTEDGERLATVVKAGKFQATVDGNHPLAGLKLRFSLKIEDVRDASAEEIAHGHAHGVGGHQH
jgi:FKBP-type peptidyl-prolyl cis-trans isomerase SlyD